jgi:hypothetical protein
LPDLQEIVGGKDDGETVWSGFNFDVLEFLTAFEAEAVSFSTRQLAHPPELTFEGKFCKKYVFLHVCLEPPDDAAFLKNNVRSLFRSTGENLAPETKCSLTCPTLSKSST